MPIPGITPGRDRGDTAASHPGGETKWSPVVTKVATRSNALATAIVAFLTLWSLLATGRCFWRSLFFFSLMVFGSRSTGSLLLSLAGERMQSQVSFPMEFLLGFFSLNLWLYGSIWILPLSLPANLMVGLAIMAIFKMVSGKRAGKAGVPHSPSRVEVLAVGLSLVAASLLSLDFIMPIVERGDTVIFKTWLDSFYHSGIIRVFSAVPWRGGLQDSRLAGESIYAVYNYACYLWPATYSSAAGVSAYSAYGGFMVPLGTFISGLGAYCIARYCFGDWGGFAAAVCVLSIPDASFYGMKIQWFSYHWLQQIAPGGMYGSALLSLSWIFAFIGCRERSWRYLLVGHLITLVTVAFKAHLFVLNAPIIWMYPVFSYPGLSRRVRLVLGTAAMALLMSGVVASRQSAYVPELWLDGSSFRAYLDMVLLSADRMPFRMFFVEALSGVGAVPLVAGMAIIAGGTFGILPIAYLAATVLARGKPGEYHPWFPWAIGTFYCILALSLPLDTKGVGTPEELLHRHFVWAYFALATWIGGTCSVVLVQWVRSPATRFRRVLLSVFLAVPLVLPYFIGRGVLKGPAWGVNFQSLPVTKAYFDIAREIRSHSRRWEIVQDSLCDPRLVLSATCDRQPYVAGPNYRMGKEYTKRKNEVEALNRTSSPKEAEDFFKYRRIAWYVLHPQDEPRWEKELSDRLAIQRDGYRVYRFNTW